MLGAWVELRRASDRRWLLGAVLLVLLSTLFFWRDPISRLLFPDPRMNRQLERGQAALAHGKLSAADGSGARELFESVLAIDPDQMTARQGLIDVRNAAIARAERALGQHRLVESRKNLDLAQALSAPTVQLQPLLARLHDLEEASSDTSALLAQAAAPGVSEDASLALLDRVLKLDADNAVALEGRRELLAGWLVRAENLLAANKVAAAQRLVDRVIAEDPAHLDLPPVRAELGEALSRVQAEQARVLNSAQADERAGRIDIAARKYQQVIDAQGESTAAQEGLRRLASRIVRLAERQAADFQFRQAEASLARARRWNAGAAEIEIAEQRLAQSKQTQKRLLHAPASHDRTRLPDLVTDAEQAMARGDFITPPGTSAWDKLRVAAAIAPDAPLVRKLQRDFAQGSRACFEQALVAGQLRRAQTCLEANLAQEPAGPAAADARQQLAERWLAYAEERIGASDYAEAEKAIGFARHWQPRHPRLKATAERLRRARGNSR
jgi:tetratricopeptide (TPR) repeat protein